MIRLRAGILGYALMRAAGFVAIVAGAAMLLGVLLPGSSGPVGAIGELLSGTHAPAAERFGITVPLAFLALLAASILAMPLGIVHVHRSIAARVGGLVAGLFLALPAFWLGLVLALVVAGQLRWLPAGGFLPWQQDVGGALRSLILPAAALALPLAALLGREVARTFVGLVDDPLTFAARTQGMTEREALRRIGLARALPTLMRRAGALFALALAGAMVIESAFYLPGVGRLLFDSMAAHDHAAVRGALFGIVVLGALGAAIADIAAAFLAPPAAIEARV